MPEIVALSVDTPERSAALRRDLALPFRLLCDPTKQVVRDWGLLSPEKGGIAYTATFGLDKDRRVVFRSLDTVLNRSSGEQAIQAVIHPPPVKDPKPKRRTLLPSPKQLARALWNGMRHGLGAPRGR